MEDIRAGFLSFRHGQFVKDGRSTILYVDMTADMLEFRLSAIDNTGLFTGMKTTFVFF